AIYFWPGPKVPEKPIKKPQPVVKAEAPPPVTPPAPEAPKIVAVAVDDEPAQEAEEQETPSHLKKKKKLILPYVIDQGLAVVQGDVVIGKPTDPNAPETGNAEIPSLNKWSSRVIPYYIQPDLTNPDRVKAALTMFEGTGIQFVPYKDEAD